MNFTSEITCDLSVDFYYDQPLQVDPDIAGIGVVTNFIATAYITWTLFLLNYVFAYEPPKPTGRSADGADDQGSHPMWQSNPIDLHTLAWIRRIIRIKKRHPRVAQIFDECILNMCDVQIMTGFALLSCGFILAFSRLEPLSSYHWFLIVCLAWFSAVTHLAGLSILRTYFDGRPRVKAARIVLMFLLLVALVIAMIPTGYFNWRDPRSAAAPQSPAICFFDISAASRLWNQTESRWYYSEVREVTDTPAMQQMVLAVMLLVLGFTNRCIKLFQPLSRTLRQRIREPAHDYFEILVKYLVRLLIRPPPKRNTLVSAAKHVSFWVHFWILAVFAPLFGLFLSGRFFADLIGSMLAEIIWVLMAIIWGTVKFASLTSDSSGLFSTSLRPLQPEFDQQWTFGQMMAVALLMSPIFSLIWKFGELFMQVDDNAIEQERQMLDNNIEVDTQEAGESHGVSRTPHRDQHAGTVRPGLFDDNAMTDNVSLILDRDYYRTAPWIWPAIVQSYLALMAVAVLSIILTNVTNDFTMTQFWLTSLHFLPYILLGLPAAFAATMIAGLILDQWYCHKSGWKWNLLFWTGSCIHGIYFVAFFLPYYHFLGPLPAPFVILPFSLYTMYCFCGGLVIFGKKVKSYLLTNRTIS